MQSVVIVGSNRGIGLELVREYSKRGAKVFALCRKTSEELNKIENVVVLGKGHTKLNMSLLGMSGYFFVSLIWYDVIQSNLN